MLLHRGERHVVALGQLAHRGFGIHDAEQDVAPGRVGQRPEQLVEGLRARLLSYNHLVVDASTKRVAGPPPPPRSGSSDC